MEKNAIRQKFNGCIETLVVTIESSDNVRNNLYCPRICKLIDFAQEQSKDMSIAKTKAYNIFYWLEIKGMYNDGERKIRIVDK